MMSMMATADENRHNIDNEQSEVEIAFEEDAMCETFELFTEFDGASRDHYADQKKFATHSL